MEEEIISMDDVKMLYLTLKDDLCSDYDRRRLALTLLQIKAKGEKFSEALQKIEDDKKAEEEKWTKYRGMGVGNPIVFGHGNREADDYSEQWGLHGASPFADFCYEGY